jgi:hypothetical protein
MSTDIDWLQREAAKHGLELLAHELVALRDQLDRIREMLSESEVADAMDLEPPYRFVAAVTPVEGRRR